jgi:hypothetical protein
MLQPVVVNPPSILALNAIVRRFARPVFFGALGLLALSQAGPAEAAAVNTYNGAQCAAVFPGDADNLERTHGVIAKAPALVVCPIVKHIFNSTAGVTAGVVASGGTSCSLESFDVFTNASKVSGFKAFPGTGLSALEFTIPSSFRGAMHLRCFLGTNDFIRSYAVTEQ